MQAQVDKIKGLLRTLVKKKQKAVSLKNLIIELSNNKEDQAILRPRKSSTSRYRQHGFSKNKKLTHISNSTRGRIHEQTSEKKWSEHEKNLSNQN